MPIPNLSTLYIEDELALFAGTTLIPATRAKLKKLYTEYRTLRQCTKQLEPLSHRWWGFKPREMDQINDQLRAMGLEVPDEDEDPLITLEDWIILDAFYRSRALEWPGQGEAMVPAIDLANHDVPANAEFEVQSDGNGVLNLKQGVEMKEGEELFISYGDLKSPLEILFSYGFLPTHADTARSILLSLPSPENDPFGPPKSFVAAKENCVPGMRVYEDGEDIKWDSEVLWLMILNEEDGLDFKVAQGPDDERELHVIWKEDEVKLRDLKTVLEKDEMFDLFKLRAIVIVLQQIEEQLDHIAITEQELQAVEEKSAHYELYQTAQKLRSMESALLSKARESLVREVC